MYSTTPELEKTVHFINFAIRRAFFADANRRKAAVWPEAVYAPTSGRIGKRVESMLYFSFTQRRNVSCAMPSLQAAAREDVLLAAQSARSCSNASGTGLGGRPKRTPRRLAAAIPSRCRGFVF